MTIDLLKLFVLLLFVVVALVSALFVVEPTWLGADDLDRAARAPVCDDFHILGGSWSRWWNLLFLALNAVVDGRAQDALLMCVLHEQNENRYLLWLFTYCFLIFVVVLLLNMLIAMFSRSFDMMYDSMSIHVQTHFARTVVAWCASAPEPPPLNLLQVPYKLLDISIALFQPLRCRTLGRLRRAQSSRQAQNGDVAHAGASGRSVTTASEPPPATASKAAPTAAEPPAAPALVLDVGADDEIVSSNGADPSASRSGHGPATPQQRRSSFEGGLGRLLRRTHGTFSGMGLQPAVYWLLNGESGGGCEEPRDCTWRWLRIHERTVPSMTPLPVLNPTATALPLRPCYPSCHHGWLPSAVHGSNPRQMRGRPSSLSRASGTLGRSGRRRCPSASWHMTCPTLSPSAKTGLSRRSVGAIR